jgi:hypothetical protein
MASLIRSIAIATTIVITSSIVSATVAMADVTANFDGFTLDATKKTASVGGSTGGSVSIPAITGGSDRSGNKCLGFGDSKPDHIMTLTQAITKLNLKVNSSGRDTTIVIQGPDGELRCGDDTGSKKDASFSDSNWSAGTYKIWVGSMAPGDRGNYRLSAQAE